MSTLAVVRWISAVLFAWFGAGAVATAVLMISLSRHR